MDTSSLAVQFTAPVAIAVGLLVCFWGYRLLKVTLGLIGFILGASAGWQIALALVPGNTGAAAICAVTVGLIGVILCVWLFWLGIFLLGASAGAVVAAGVFSGTGHPAQPFIILLVALLVGLLTMLVKKFVLIISTAFGGAYLITAGVLHFITGSQGSAPVWFGQLQNASTPTQEYLALGLWLLLALMGMAFQFRAGRRRVETPPGEKKTA